MLVVSFARYNVLFCSLILHTKGCIVVKVVRHMELYKLYKLGNHHKNWFMDSKDLLKIAVEKVTQSGMGK